MTVRKAEYADRAALAAAVAACIVTDIEKAVATQGAATLIVPGGTTPVAVFERLATSAAPWEKVTVIPCDERWVGVEHADSNEGLIRRHLLKGAAAKAKIVGLYRPTATPSEAVAEVTAALTAVPRPFSSVFLGMGEDGHFASLFPGRQETPPALALDNAKDVMVLTEPAKGHPRIGLTLRALIDCSHVLLAVTGAEKRIVLDKAMTNINADTYPIAALLRQARTPVDILTSS